MGVLLPRAGHHHGAASMRTLYPAITPYDVGTLKVADRHTLYFEQCGNPDGKPVVMLHGGPGTPSYYFNPLLELGKDRPVITFDQLGCGRSDRITDTTMMTIDSYVEQTRKLLDHLGVKEFYLYGHSWGTMLGTDYYLKYKDGVKGLILASPCLSSKLWVSDADTLISTLPDSVSIILRNDIKGIKQDSAKLKRAIQSYTDNFYLRRTPISADIDSINSQAGTNVYQYMWGSSEFFALGTLKNYDRTNDLGKIEVPTLYTTGEFDSARPSTVNYYRSLTPNSQLIIISNAGHFTMQDNPNENIKAISDFLNGLENP
jgi:proline iminopeptidase